MKISQVFKDFKGRKGSQVERRGEGAKWVAFLMSLADTQALRDFALSLQRREDWNSALPETRADQTEPESKPRTVYISSLCFLYTLTPMCGNIIYKAQSQKKRKNPNLLGAIIFSPLQRFFFN